MGLLKASIVLTGGPCAGKTTTIAKVKEYLEGLGYHVLLLNECATELINGGIRPFGTGAVSVYEFENEVLNLQLYKEKRYLDIINKLPDSLECIILCDRGALDVKAYLGQELFDKMIEENNLNVSELTNRYDLVIHMVTVASDIKNKYNTNTNTARFEDADEAVNLDKRTSDAWNNHTNLNIIKATPVIEEKIENVVNIVKEFLNK